MRNWLEIVTPHRSHTGAVKPASATWMTGIIAGATALAAVAAAVIRRGKGGEVKDEWTVGEARGAQAIRDRVAQLQKLDAAASRGDKGAAIKAEELRQALVAERSMAGIVDRTAKPVSAQAPKGEWTRVMTQQVVDSPMPSRARVACVSAQQCVVPKHVSAAEREAQAEREAEREALRRRNAELRREIGDYRPYSGLPNERLKKR